MSEKLSAENIVGFLDDMFSKFDDLTEKYEVEKIKTIGDAYMVVSALLPRIKIMLLFYSNLDKNF